jgi:signal transduction histidine kinase
MPQIENNHVKLAADWGDEPILADCAPDLLHIVMVNLLSNGVKYGNQGGEMRVRVRCEDGRVAVSVWNEGPGFKEEDRGHLFRKFSRLKSPELMKRKGTGVGLYTTWRIVKAHNGDIGARSELGKWAEFTFEIPQTRA